SRQKGEPTRFASVARLAEKKGLEYALTALGQVIKRCDDFIYDIIGGGPLRESLEQQISKLGLTEHVNLLGWRTQDQVRAHLHESHVLLAPSVTAKAGDQEGTPTAIAEALMMGLPVLSTQHSGIPEMVQHDVSGYLVPERDVDALAAYLLKLMGNPQSWQALGQAGSDFARCEFDVNSLNDQLIEIYQTITQQTD
ncbi:MAG: glycosyltransferase, partial [Phycisphaeraceae bacterium]|nr:glycosyltransferase [Phycisphaeraceae bacterium]